MKYIFLTYSIGGISGCPSYVSNKTRWLKEKGWDVVVFDHLGTFRRKVDIKLENLRKFENNRMMELFFPPAYFSHRQRQKILGKLIDTIGKDDKYVVESNTSRLALWGELLASMIGAKHLIMEVGEHLDIKNEKEFSFINFKFGHNEWFSINPGAAKLKFAGWRELTEEEAKDHTFSASMGVVLEDVPMDELSNLKRADYNILSFGRRKSYFDVMFEEIVRFAESCPGSRVIFIIMGAVELKESDIKLLNRATNLSYFLIPSQRPVPKVVFDFCDVVIATAGCANLSFRNGYKTISMNVERCTPLGVMGYTTINSVFENEGINDNVSLCSLLQDVLVNKIYCGAPTLIKKPSGRGFEYQMTLIDKNIGYWADVDKIILDNSRVKRLIIEIVLRLGLIRVFRY